ncbi:unnamed protein product [Allacma fusca]|uniref:Uncharacterized protein n=1 Tax=Allacma fusca TaxID=39272 RepID=A0A8J2Q3S2_9HEXA|nr:unnamed protein product [Allacma fusca]
MKTIIISLLALATIFQNVPETEAFVGAIVSMALNACVGITQATVGTAVGIVQSVANALTGGFGGPGVFISDPMGPPMGAPMGPPPPPIY